MIRLLSALPTTVLIALLLLSSSARKQDKNQQEQDYHVIADGIRLTQLRDLAQLIEHFLRKNDSIRNAAS